MKQWPFHRSAGWLLVVAFLLVVVVQQQALPTVLLQAATHSEEYTAEPAHAGYLSQLNTRRLDGQPHRFPIFTLSLTSKLLRDAYPCTIQPVLAVDRSFSVSPVLLSPAAPRAPPNILT